MKHILKIVFPKTVSNDYLGLKFSLYIFYILVIILFIRSFYYVTMSDLDALLSNQAPAAANLLNRFGVTQIIVSILNLLGMSQLLLISLYGVVMIRYKSLIPLMYVWIFIDTISRIIIPITSSQTPSNNSEAMFNVILMIVIPVLFVLSIIPSKKLIHR